MPKLRVVVASGMARTLAASQSSTAVQGLGWKVLLPLATRPSVEGERHLRTLKATPRKLITNNIHKAVHDVLDQNTSKPQTDPHKPRVTQKPQNQRRHIANNSTCTRPRSTRRTKVNHEPSRLYGACTAPKSSRFFLYSTTFAKLEGGSVQPRELVGFRTSVRSPTTLQKR